MKTFSALLALCAGNSSVTGEFPTQRPVTRTFGVFFDLCLNRRLSKQWWGWWFETPSRPLWRHCNVKIIKANSQRNSMPAFKENDEMSNYPGILRMQISKNHLHSMTSEDHLRKPFENDAAQAWWNVTTQCTEMVDRQHNHRTHCG